MEAKKIPYTLLTTDEVINITTLGRSSIYNMMNPNNQESYDPTFPKPLMLSKDKRNGKKTGGQPRIAWRSDELFSWLEARQRSENGHNAPGKGRA